jgi:hypothetical protein
MTKKDRKSQRALISDVTKSSGVREIVRDEVNFEPDIVSSQEITELKFIIAATEEVGEDASDLRKILKKRLKLIGKGAKSVVNSKVLRRAGGGWSLGSVITNACNIKNREMENKVRKEYDNYASDIEDSD